MENNLKTKIYVNKEGISLEDFKNNVKLSFELGRLYSDKEFEDVCEFVEIEPSTASKLLKDRKSVENNIKVIDEYFRGIIE